MLLMPARIKPKSFEPRGNSFLFFFLPGVDAPRICRAGLGARLLPQSYQYLNLSEGADRVGGQLRGDKDRVPLQWRNQIWQFVVCVFCVFLFLGKRCSECGYSRDS